MSGSLIVGLITCTVLLLAITIWLLSQLKKNHSTQSANVEKQFIILQERLQNNLKQRDEITKLLNEHRQHQQQHRQAFDKHQMTTLKLIQDALQQGLKELGLQVSSTFKESSESLKQRVSELTTETSKRLQEISGQVDKRLTTGFEKTTETFSNVIKRLTIIDEAQKKITELSSNVIGLQEVLNDKRSRGAFGEVQLSSLVRNMIPESHFAMQHTLSNDKRVDCILFLPPPTGNIAIDAKFPLETYKRLTENKHAPNEQRQLEQQFRVDIRRHIQDISSKYIIHGETADGAVMFIPSESIFAEIHAHYADVVDYAQHQRVWLVSPTTLMATLTTVRAVLKDDATRQQVHIIQQHIIGLSKDFERFQQRMNNLARHINQAQQDVEQVHKSSQKITNKFQKIERVELKESETVQ